MNQHGASGSGDFSNLGSAPGAQHHGGGPSLGATHAVNSGGPARAAQSTGLVRAGFWERFIASFIDGIIVSFLLTPVQVVLALVIGGIGGGGEENLPLMIVVQVIAVALQFGCYIVYAGLLGSRKGATWGKMVIGLKIIDPRTGRYPTFWQAGLRDTLGKFVSYSILMIGFLMAAFREDKRALHDMMFNTIVVKVRN